MVAELVLFAPGARPCGRVRVRGDDARDRGRACLAAVRTYVEDLASLCRELASRQAIETEDTIVTGGSSFFDVVAEVLLGEARHRSDRAPVQGAT